MDARPMIEVSPQFQRSVRVDEDFDRADALQGYICQSTAQRVLETVTHHLTNSQQRAFTWTGPYGGGKSSLALALAQLAGGTDAVKEAARKALRIQKDDPIYALFGSERWLVVPVVGRREAVDIAIGEAIDRWAPRRGPKPQRDGRRDVIAELIRRAETHESGGVLLVLDELGKLLESAAHTGDDIYFYQELAEAASRTNGRLVVVGVLHQSFDQYAARASHGVRVEWAKVQGRFVDIPIITAVDEVIELIGGAVVSHRPHPESLAVAKQIADAIRDRRPSSPSSLAVSLDKCWPLHPVTAALLGPSSRRKFGQNERSVFGFLSSPELLGFQDFLREFGQGDIPYYRPSRYWDYLRANFEPAILSSPDGHRWALVVDAVERAEARFGGLHVDAVKTIGLIDLFKNGSGLVASTDVVAASVEPGSRERLDGALGDLAAASILIYRKHLESWGVFAGSDFDIEAALQSARGEIAGDVEAQLRRLAVLPPLSARRHYWETGTLRWFERSVVLAESAADGLPSKSYGGSSGRFVLLLPSGRLQFDETVELAKVLSKRHAPDVTLFGVVGSKVDLVDRAAELAALYHVEANEPLLRGDSVARREVEARLQQLKGDLEDALRNAFSSAKWYFDGRAYGTKPDVGLTPLASRVCDRVYKAAPVIQSELVNRDSLSTSAAKAQRQLLHRMIAYGDQPNLGYEGCPADAGIYYTTLVPWGVHTTRRGQGVFVAPDAPTLPDEGGLHAFWSVVRQRLIDARSTVTLEEIYEIARQPPFGIKRGVLPIIALAFLLVHRSEIGVYMDGLFTPELNEAHLDEWLQDASRVSWKWVHMDRDVRQLLTRLAAKLEGLAHRPVEADPLDSARALVQLALTLPGWTQRTQRLSATARTVRTTLLRATDPLKVIFVDLPQQLGVSDDSNALVDAIVAVVAELQAAYSAELERVASRMLNAIDHSGPLSGLRERARAVNGKSGDFKLDAFAGRLEAFNGDQADIEGLISLATNKPATLLSDHDMEAASVQLAKWGFDFRRIEALASLEGRKASRRALAVVFGAGDTVSATFDVAERDLAEVQRIAQGMVEHVVSKRVSPDLFLAALAEAGAQALELQAREAQE